MAVFWLTCHRTGNLLQMVMLLRHLNMRSQGSMVCEGTIKVLVVFFPPLNLCKLAFWAASTYAVTRWPWLYCEQSLYRDALPFSWCLWQKHFVCQYQTWISDCSTSPNYEIWLMAVTYTVSWITEVTWSATPAVTILGCDLITGMASSASDKRRSLSIWKLYTMSWKEMFYLDQISKSCD